MSPVAGGTTPGRSRTARRYESVATRRVPVSVASTSTPVRIGRAESPLAALDTCATAAASRSPSSSTASPKSGSFSWGYSSTGSSRNLNAGPAPRISTSPSLEPRVTAPCGILEIAPSASLAGTTTEPSSRTSTSVIVRTVISRSVPVTRRVLPATSQRTPWRIGNAALGPTARAARENTSARSSRSARMRTDVYPF